MQDADLLTALAPWAFTDTAGRRHEARLVGWWEALRWLQWFEWAGEDPRQQAGVADRILRRLYPMSWRLWWRVALGRAVDPRACFRQLPGPVQLAVLTDFFRHAGLTLSVPPTPWTTSSANSSPSTVSPARLNPSGA